MLACIGIVGRHNGKREQQLILDHRDQFERLLTHLQRVIAFRHGIVRSTFPQHGIDELAVHRQGCRLQTTLANHLHLDIESAAHDDQPLLVTPKL
ncbi:hypothetical protein D3C78_1586730 [compost metagenome]